MKISSTVPGACLIQDPLWDPRYVKDQRRDTKKRIVTLKVNFHKVDRSQALCSRDTSLAAGD